MLSSRHTHAWIISLAPHQLLLPCTWQPQHINIWDVCSTSIHCTPAPSASVSQPTSLQRSTNQLATLWLQVYHFSTFMIDVAHGRILPYDPQNFSVGIAKESGLVPLLLAPIWLLFPYLQVSPVGDTCRPRQYLSLLEQLVLHAHTVLHAHIVVILVSLLQTLGGFFNCSAQNNRIS